MNRTPEKREAVIRIKKGAENRFGALFQSRKQEGSVLLISLIFLILLAVIGLNGIRTASTDLQITRSYRVYHENLYLADGAAYEAVQKIDDNEVGNGTWIIDINATTAVPEGSSLRNNSTFWSSNAVSSDFSNDTQYVAYRNATVDGDIYFVFGRGFSNGGESIVEIKYERD
ncbi:MAG: PilX N-terminal domain-containing pilus assembly protein [Desulfonatronovibrionaceae bacterium]